MIMRRQNPDSQDRLKFFKRGIRFLPFLFTLGNAFFGFCSIAFAIEGERVAAIYCIFIAALMDALDGRVARLMKVESDLGVEMDSLCDAISFCLAPAFLVYVWSLREFGFFGIIICSIFLLSGIVRLARFNLLHNEQSVFFIGLPTTIAGCFVATILLNASMIASKILYKQWSAIGMAIVILILSWLMVSTIPFPAFKKKKLRIKRHYHITGAIVLFAVIAVMKLEVFLLILFMGYFLLSVCYRLLNKEKFYE